MTKNPLPLEWVNKIFMRLHGRFGNTFFDKFRIGQLNQQGQDIGIENAKVVWSEELAGNSPERISAALQANYEYAPSCDDFKANCVVRAQINDCKALTSHVDIEASRKYANNVVNFVAEKTKERKDYRAWVNVVLADKSSPDIAVKYANEVKAMSA